MKSILSRLPVNFPAAILLVQHRQNPNYLCRCLARDSNLRVVDASDGECIQNGTVYVAPAGQHMLLEKPGVIQISEGERVSYSRPSVNVLFYSVAKHYGDKAIAVVLTGANSDGANGVVACKVKGSRVIAQHPETCAAPQMPLAAISTNCVDYILTPSGITNALISFTMVTGSDAVFPLRTFSEVGEYRF